MTSRGGTIAVEAVSSSKSMWATGGLQFDWIVVALCGWLQAGGFLDGWAHNHGKVDASVFTPWHGVLYSGFLAVSSLMVGTLLHNHAKGYDWRRALPAGYGLSFLGSLIFAAGGVGDILWHSLFGIERSIEALYSPTHLTLAVGSALIMSGPLRAAWRRPDGASSLTWRHQLPMLLSLTFMLSGFTFSAQVLHPLVGLRAAAARPGTDEMIFYLQALTVAGLLVQTELKMGFVLFAVRRWRLPPGSITLVFTLNGLAMCALDPQDDYGLMAPVVLAGLVTDGLLSYLKPSSRRPGAFRLFAFVVPVVFYLFYFIALWFMKGLWWSVHLWTGSIVLAGLASWLLSYLIVPPPEPQSQQSF